MKAKAVSPMHIDEIRSLACAVLSSTGLRHEHCRPLTETLLWFEEVGLSDQGLGTLPDLIDRVRKGEIDAKAVPKIGPEKAALAILDGRNGPPLLTLSRAAQLASEKAREYGS